MKPGRRGGLVYSTELGRTCPTCRRPLAACACPAEPEVPRGDGIVRVAREIAVGYPALAEELSTVSAEVKAGKEKTSVLRAFAERAGVQDVSSFVAVMIQSQTFGTSIAEALRVYASEMRDKRVMRAEEAANKLPTKITLGTMMFTVPPLLIVIVGPSVYAMVETFANFKV